MDKATDFDIVIVGCGPTGATLANLLAQHEVSVLILEREQTIYNLPRAVHFDDETMRVFQSVGIADELEKRTRVNPGMRFVDESGNLLLDWPRPEGIGPHAWHTSYRLHQPDLEELLREQLARHEPCTVKLGHELVTLEQFVSHVNVGYKDVNTKEDFNCTAQYVVGCDGANSTVRSSVNTETEDLGFKERWLVVDVLLNADMPELGDHTIQYCSASQAMTYCRNPGLRRRWEMALPDSLSDERAIDDGHLWTLLSRWITPDQALIERKAIYTFRSELARQWRRGRLFIAGDAAHLTPPFMGQGMCAGIRDASNLAWKLSMSVNSKAKQSRQDAHFDSDSLLDSYEHERRPHVREYIKTAIKLGSLINSLDRQTVESIASGDSSSNVRMSSIAPRLGSSALSDFAGAESSVVGTLFSQPVLSNGTKLDDTVGYQAFSVTRTSSKSVLVEGGDGAVIEISDDDRNRLSQVLDEMQVQSIFVRPDRYILSAISDEQQITKLDWSALVN